MVAQRTYTLHIEGEGDFEVLEQCMAASLAVAAETNRLTGGQENLAPWYAGLVGMIATLRARIVRAPEGWDLDAMDPDDPTSYQRLHTVFMALREKDFFFETSASKNARQLARSHHRSIEWWYRDRYRLTLNDERFLNAGLSDMWLDYWLDHYAKQAASGKATVEAEDEDFDLERILTDLESGQVDESEWEDVTGHD